MCGICGFTGNENPEILKKMNDSITHRGPDEEGFLVKGQINLGSRRLSIIDLATGKQPVYNENRTVWAVWNGEIYNFLALRNRLIDGGHHFYTDHSDSEVIVHLYEDYGSDFVHQLNGMFAIAIYDEPQEKLVLVRDRMGVKPLFYSVVDGHLIFGSEIKSILRHPLVFKRLNPTAIYHYFSFKNIPAPLTAFQNIYSLQPGEIVEFRNGSIQKKEYWRIHFTPPDAVLPEDETEIRDRIFNILEDAVKIRMVSDVPIGAYLSGGVDSSAVVALMSRFSGNPVKTFSLGYETKLKNKEEDLFYARKVSEYYGTEHYEYIMSTREIPDDIDQVIRSFDQPFSGVISTYYLSKLISKHVKVALSGDGADELFGSYLAHRLAQPMHHFALMYPEYKTGTLSMGYKSLLAPFDSKIDYLEKLYLLSGGDDSRWRYSLLTFDDTGKRTILSPDFLNSVSGDTLELVRGYFTPMTAKDPLNRMLEFDWNTLLPDQVLAFVDFLSMAHSVEVRSPFLDYRLVEYVAAIPGELKIKNGIVKDILKQTVAPILPEGVTQRPKEGFVLPVFDWMKEELKDYLTGFLTEDNLQQSGVFNTGEVLKICNGFFAGDGTLAAKVWNIAMFQVWWNNYFSK